MIRLEFGPEENKKGYRINLLLEDLLMAFPTWDGAKVGVFGTVVRYKTDITGLEPAIVVKAPDGTKKEDVLAVVQAHDPTQPTKAEALAAQRKQAAKSLVNKLDGLLGLSEGERAVMEDVLRIGGVK
jgi:hypothetical protein